MTGGKKKCRLCVLIFFNLLFDKKEKKVQPISAMKFQIDSTYFINNEPVVFLGFQDCRFFGFFREKNNPDTFFGCRLSKVRKNQVKKYTVNVGNIGNIDCETRKEADATFKEYRGQSKNGYGRASHEPVALLVNGEPVKEYSPKEK